MLSLWVQANSSFLLVDVDDWFVDNSVSVVQVQFLVTLSPLGTLMLAIISLVLKI